MPLNTPVAAGAGVCAGLGHVDALPDNHERFYERKPGACGSTAFSHPPRQTYSKTLRRQEKLSRRKIFAQSV